VATSNAPATNAPLPAGYAVANVIITIPKTGSSSFTRKAQTVGAGTASISFTLLQLNGAAATAALQTYGLTSNSPGCGTQGGNLVCSLNINAPIGSDVFLAQTFSGAAATGSLTGSGAVALTVAQNHANTASLSLDGQVASVYLASSSTFLGTASQPGAKARRNGAAAVRSAATRTVQGTPNGSTVNSMRIFVIALDSSGNTVLNPSTFDQPIQVQLIYTTFDCCGGIEPDVTNPPNLTLSVAYNSAVDPNGCGGNASATAGFTTVNVCSPSDVITATFNFQVANGPQNAVLIGSIAGTGDLSAPTGQPTTLPTGFAAGVGSLSIALFTGQVGVELFDDNDNTVTTIAGYGFGNVSGSTSLIQNTLNIFDNGFTGSFTVGGTCGAFATLTLTNNDGFGDGSILISPTAVTGGSPCTLTVGDGTNTSSVTMTVTTTAVFGS
jgi:hypothetical protein